MAIVIYSMRMERVSPNLINEPNEPYMALLGQATTCCSPEPIYVYIYIYIYIYGTPPPPKLDTYCISFSDSCENIVCVFCFRFALLVLFCLFVWFSLVLFEGRATECLGFRGFQKASLDLRKVKAVWLAWTVFRDGVRTKPTFKLLTRKPIE